MKIFDMRPAGTEVPVYPVVIAGQTSRVRRRRSWTLEEKLAIIAEVESSGDPVAVVARRHDMNANHLFNWIDRARAGTLDRRARKQAAERRPRPDSGADGAQDFIDLGVFTREEMAEALGGPCLMEIELGGDIKVRVPISVEPELLTRAVRALRAA
jgi:transposase-like protein